jgi:hypothetical protein
VKIRGGKEVRRQITGMRKWKSGIREKERKSGINDFCFELGY